MTLTPPGPLALVSPGQGSLTAVERYIKAGRLNRSCLKSGIFRSCAIHPGAPCIFAGYEGNSNQAGSGKDIMTPPEE